MQKNGSVKCQQCDKELEPKDLPDQCHIMAEVETDSKKYLLIFEKSFDVRDLQCRCRSMVDIDLWEYERTVAEKGSVELEKLHEIQVSPS
jgi:hypothetical protein